MRSKGQGLILHLTYQDIEILFSGEQGEEHLHTLLCGEVTGTGRMRETQGLVTSTGYCSRAEGRCSSGQDETDAAVVETECVWA